MLAYNPGIWIMSSVSLGHIARYCLKTSLEKRTPKSFKGRCCENGAELRGSSSSSVGVRLEGETGVRLDLTV